MPFNYDTNYTDTPDADLPGWIVEALTLADIDSIQRGGCASGAYMPAVTYHQAMTMMGEHGDDVLEYLENELGELPTPEPGMSWSGLACFYLSSAVELWASGIDVDRIISDSEEEE